MKQSHVEMIKSNERLDPSLGGTGYLPPTTAATWAEILDELRRVKAEFGLPCAAFKVLRSSVSWKNHAESRRLLIGNTHIPCKLIGGIKDWWFVSIQTGY